MTESRKTPSKPHIKALILAAGRGKRMDEVSGGGNKCLIKVHGKPLIEYSLDAATQIPEVGEIIIVVGHQAESVINRYGIEYRGKRVRYRIQHEQKGLVNAVENAAQDLEKQDFFLFLGDEIVLNGKYDEMVTLFHEEDLFVLCGVVIQPDPEQIRKTYAVMQAEDGRVYRLVEKPRRPVGNIMGTGNCLFRYEILSYIPQVVTHPMRGEKELPDLIQCAIDDANIVKSITFCDHYINVNTVDELRAVEKSWPTMQ